MEDRKSKGRENKVTKWTRTLIRNTRNFTTCTFRPVTVWRSWQGNLS